MIGNQDTKPFHYFTQNIGGRIMEANKMSILARGLKRDTPLSQTRWDPPTYRKNL